MNEKEVMFRGTYADSGQATIAVALYLGLARIADAIEVKNEKS